MMPYPSHFCLEAKSKLEFVSFVDTFFIPLPHPHSTSYFVLLHSNFCKILRMLLTLLITIHYSTSKLVLAVPLCILLIAGQTCCLLFSQNISFSFLFSFQLNSFPNASLLSLTHPHSCAHCEASKTGLLYRYFGFSTKILKSSIPGLVKKPYFLKPLPILTICF